MKKISWLLPLWFLGQIALSAPVALNLKFFGDSMTAGFLANTSLLDEINRRAFRPIRRNLRKYNVAKWWDPESPHHQLDKYNHPDLAWSFLLSQFFTEDDRDVAVSNYAVSSAQTKDLALQIRAASEDKEAKDLKGRPVVFVWIGHNDLLFNLSKVDEVGAKYRDEMKDGLAKLAKGQKGVIYVVLPIIDITEVYETVKDFVWGEKRGLLKKKELTCKNTWRQYLPYKWFMPGGEKTFTEKVRPKVNAMNDSIGELIDELNPKTPGPDDNVYVYWRNLFKDQHFIPDYFAEDCLHASEEGQAKIAQEVFERLKKEKAFDEIFSRI